MNRIRLTKDEIEAGRHLDFSPLHHDFHRLPDGSLIINERRWWDDSPLGESGDMPEPSGR